MNTGSSKTRKRIAREAANLLYLGTEKEYKQAKLKAAKTFGFHFLPTNLEVAMEFDQIAEENEGSHRQERLIQMRKDALKLMQTLKKYKTLLIGSVWRGTIHRNSDIDIIAYHDEPEDVLEILRRHNFKIEQTEWMSVTKEGKRKSSLHVHIILPTEEKVEIKITTIQEDPREKCEIYGDEITGLNVQELSELLKENPVQKFVPF